MLMPSMVPTVWATLDSAMLDLVMATLVPDVTLPTLLELSMLPRGRLRLRLMPSTVLMVLDMLVLATLDWATVMPVLATLPLLLLLSLLLLQSPLSLPATPTSPPLPPSPPLELPLLPSLLSEELMPVLDVTLPTLLESSMLPKKF